MDDGSGRLACHEAIAILTVEFFVEVATRGDGECANELLELDGAILVLVEDAEHERGELGGVSVGEELGIDLDESLLGQQPVGTILKEAFVPLPYLLL